MTTPTPPKPRVRRAPNGYWWVSVNREWLPFRTWRTAVDAALTYSAAFKPVQVAPDWSLLLNTNRQCPLCFQPIVAGQAWMNCNEWAEHVACHKADEDPS